MKIYFITLFLLCIGCQLLAQPCKCLDNIFVSITQGTKSVGLALKDIYRLDTITSVQYSKNGVEFKTKKLISPRAWYDIENAEISNCFIITIKTKTGTKNLYCNFQSAIGEVTETIDTIRLLIRLKKFLNLVLLRI
jgi:hypothetical protein